MGFIKSGFITVWLLDFIYLTFVEQCVRRTITLPLLMRNHTSMSPKKKNNSHKQSFFLDGKRLMKKQLHIYLLICFVNHFIIFFFFISLAILDRNVKIDIHTCIKIHGKISKHYFTTSEHQINQSIRVSNFSSHKKQMNIYRL